MNISNKTHINPAYYQYLWEELMQEQNEISWIIPLVKSIRYTSYQFYAKSEPAHGISVEQLLIKEILYILQWIKKKCIGNDSPNDVNLPEFLKNIPSPEEFSKYSLNDLNSFRYNIGYQLEVIVTKDKKSWAINILEPDRGPKPDKPEEARKPVPGRFFETDIGLRRNSNNIEIATRTYVHEPIGTEEECDAFRQAFVTELIRDKNIHLKNIWQIEEKPYEISNKESYENFIKWLSWDEREALAVVYSATPAIKKEIINDKADEKAEDSKEISDKNYFEEFQTLARKNRAYAFFFTIPENRRDSFVKDLASIDFSGKTSTFLNNEDLLIIDARKYDNSDVHAFGMCQYCSDYSIKQLVDKSIKKYYERKKVNFYGVQFVTDLKDIQAQETDEYEKSKSDLIEELRKWKDDYHSLKNSSEADITYERNEKERVIKQKNEEIKKLKEDLHQHKMHCESCLEQQISELKEKDEIIKRLKNFQNRPKKFKDIPKWVEENFNDRLIMCRRAQDEIEDIKSEYDLDNICDAIEFLALDYYEQLTNGITEHQINEKCSVIYNNRFKITKQSIPKITNTKDYKFSYYNNKGTLVNGTINMHLYLEGKEPRIYYIFDKEDKRIVIASLPKHLKY